MEYMYAAMLLNKAGTDIDEKSLTKVLEAAGVKVDKAKVTVVVNALKGVDIEKVLKESTVAPVTAAPAASHSNASERLTSSSSLPSVAPYLFCLLLQADWTTVQEYPGSSDAG